MQGWHVAALLAAVLVITAASVPSSGEKSSTRVHYEFESDGLSRDHYFQGVSKVDLLNAFPATPIPTEKDMSVSEPTMFLEQSSTSQNNKLSKVSKHQQQPLGVSAGGWSEDVADFDVLHRGAADRQFFQESNRDMEGRRRVQPQDPNARLNGGGGQHFDTPMNAWEDDHTAAMVSQLRVANLITAAKQKKTHTPFDAKLLGKLALTGISREQQLPADHQPNQQLLHKLISTELIFPRQPVATISSSEYQDRQRGGSSPTRDDKTIQLRGHTERPTQIVPDNDIQDSNLSPILDVNNIDIRTVQRECPRKPCGEGTNCSHGSRGICCAGGQHCCPQNATCLNTNPPTCVYDLKSDPHRCLTEYCLEDHHCPLQGVSICCSGGETCCPFSYKCTINSTKCGFEGGLKIRPVAVIPKYPKLSLDDWKRLKIPLVNDVNATSAVKKPSRAELILKGLDVPPLDPIKDPRNNSTDSAPVNKLDGGASPTA